MLSGSQQMLETDSDKILPFVSFHRIPLDEEFFPASIIRRQFWCDGILRAEHTEDFQGKSVSCRLLFAITHKPTNSGILTLDLWFLLWWKTKQGIYQKNNIVFFFLTIMFILFI